MDGELALFAIATFADDEFDDFGIKDSICVIDSLSDKIGLRRQGWGIETTYSRNEAGIFNLALFFTRLGIVNLYIHFNKLASTLIH